jgi:phosphatidylserine decarboxylase
LLTKPRTDLSQAHYPHPIIAREGWPYVGLSFALAVLVAVFFGALWSLPFWLVALFVLQFFRDPPRLVTAAPNVVVSPADGKVIAVMPMNDPWLNRPSIKVSVFMNVFNVHSNRSPVNGKVFQLSYHPGLFVNADFDKASEHNERNALCIRTTSGHDITCVQVAGLIARRILCYADVGSVLTRGERYGFIRFGSRVDLYLPTYAHIRVAIGDTVSAALTAIADLPEA